MSNIQIQSVLYKNEKKDILRSLEYLACAVEYAKKNEHMISLVVMYGDASPEPIFEKEELDNLEKTYKDRLIIKYIFFNENTGTAKGHNLLGKDTQSGYIVTLNPDIIVAPDIFCELLRPFEIDGDDIGISEARQTPIEHPKEYNVKTGETSWASTACAMFRAEVFHEVGGFDETFFMYCDDVDFSWRVRMIGKKIIYQPSAVVFHDKRLSASSAKWIPSNAEQYYSAEAFLLMSHKWSRSDLTLTALAYYKTKGNEVQKKAAKSYEDKKAAGKLPNPIDKKHKIGEFINFNFGEMRFSL